MFLKDADAVLDYAVDWSAACGDQRTVVSSIWTSEPAGLQLGGATMEPRRTLVRVSGGMPGCLYRIGNRVGFSDGTSDERSLALRVEER